MSLSETQPLSLTGKRWLVRDCDERVRDSLASQLGCSPIVARLLANRGVVISSTQEPIGLD